MPRSTSLRNDGASPTADFQLIPVRIFKEKRVITRTVFRPDLRALQVFAPCLTDNLSDVIDLFARLCPKCDSRIVGAMIRIFGEAKKFRRFAGALFFERTPFLRALIEGKPNCRQNFGEEFLGPRPITDTQIDVIKETSLQG